MAFGIIRARNLSMGDLANTEKHNARRYDRLENFPANVDPNGRSYESYLMPYGGDNLYKDETTLEEAVNARIREKHVGGVKSNSNVAIEYVLTVNDKKVWRNYFPGGFFSNAQSWLEDRHGRNSTPYSGSGGTLDQ